MTIFAAMGVIITSAAVVIYPQSTADELWDPMKLVSKFDSVEVVAVSMFTVVVATLAVNIAANVVSPANDFANAFPRWISFRLGGLITGVLGIVMQPWQLLANPAKYIDGWLVGYSGGMGAIAGAGAAGIGVLATRGRATEIYPETVVTFRLVEPITINTTRAVQAFQPVRQTDYEQRQVDRRPAPRYGNQGGYYGGGYNPYFYGGPSLWWGPGYYGYWGPRYYGGPTFVFRGGGYRRR